MKGLLAHSSPLTQLITFICIAIVAFACFLVVGVVGTIALQAITGIPADSLVNVAAQTIKQPGVLNFLRGMQLAQFMLLFVLPAWICSYLFSYEPNRFIGFQRPNLNAFWIWSILIMLISLPFIQLIGELNQRIVFPSGLKEWMDKSEQSAQGMVKAMLSSQSPKDLMLNLFFIAALAGIGEELFFRGLLQRLLSRMLGRWAGILIAAALFSAVHMQFYGFFPRFLLGIVLGVLFAYSGSLWVSMLAHFFYDAALIVAAYFYPSLLETESSIPISNQVIPAIFSLVLSVFLIWFMAIRSRKNPPMEPSYAKETSNNPF